jgi:DNA-directed RNA polymerase specialized sigma24 family protein
LPFHQREAFIFQQEGFSVEEICTLTDENFETVKSRLRYARNNLKTLLGKSQLGQSPLGKAS